MTTQELSCFSSWLADSRVNEQRDGRGCRSLQPNFAKNGFSRCSWGRDAFKRNTLCCQMARKCVTLCKCLSLRWSLGCKGLQCHSLSLRRFLIVRLRRDHTRGNVGRGGYSRSFLSSSSPLVQCSVRADLPDPSVVALRSVRNLSERFPGGTDNTWRLPGHQENCIREPCGAHSGIFR